MVGGRTFSAISAGYEHACGASPGVGAFCWGSNEFGSLGDGTKIDQSAPKALPTDRGVFTAITAGVYHTCALIASGQAFCWGLSNFGQIGDGTLGTPLAPVAVSGGHVFSAIGAGNGHTCAVADDARVFCWGGNGAGQLGDGTTTDRLVPALVSFGSPVTLARP
jgi:alpha-tubulin suppressor-like RCC1 family protein